MKVCAHSKIDSRISQKTASYTGIIKSERDRAEALVSVAAALFIKDYMHAS